mmetsp:Transcript_7565/g.23608  ORF Transcript_7565/g.23608 Transcript_7565/m.23608 type:complete len:225 (-) Transcript_7565:45-719(-)
MLQRRRVVGADLTIRLGKAKECRARCLLAGKRCKVMVTSAEPHLLEVLQRDMERHLDVARHGLRGEEGVVVGGAQERRVRHLGLARELAEELVLRRRVHGVQHRQLHRIRPGLARHVATRVAHRDALAVATDRHGRERELGPPCGSRRLENKLERCVPREERACARFPLRDLRDHVDGVGALAALDDVGPIAADDDRRTTVHAARREALGRLHGAVDDELKTAI